MSFKVFISYSTCDINRVNQVKDMLEDTQSSVFIAKYSVSPGENLKNSIATAIEDCDLFILLWSENASSSEWVPQEIGMAKSLDKAVMPVLLHKDLKLPGFLEGMKYLPLYENPAEKLSWLREHVFQKANKKARKNGLIWLGIGTALLYLFTGDDTEDSI